MFYETRVKLHLKIGVALEAITNALVSFGRMTNPWIDTKHPVDKVLKKYNYKQNKKLRKDHEVYATSQHPGGWYRLLGVYARPLMEDYAIYAAIYCQTILTEFGEQEQSYACFICPIALNRRGEFSKKVGEEQRHGVTSLEQLARVMSCLEAAHQAQDIISKVKKAPIPSVAEVMQS